jgi:hypothetical protein
MLVPQFLSSHLVDGSSFDKTSKDVGLLADCQLLEGLLLSVDPILFFNQFTDHCHLSGSSSSLSLTAMDLLAAFTFYYRKKLKCCKS